MDEIEKKISFLKEVKLFKDLSTTTLASIAEHAQWQTISPGQLLATEGSQSSGIYIIASGKVSIKSSKKFNLKLEKFDFFGEIEALQRIPLLGTATVDQEGAMLKIERECFIEMTFEHPQLLLSVTHRIIDSLKKIIDSSQFKS